NEGSGLLRAFLGGSFADLDVDILQDVLDIGPVPPIVLQVLHQRRLQGQNLADKPLLNSGCGHHRSEVALCAVTIGFPVVDHPASVPTFAGWLLDSTAIGTDGAREMGGGRSGAN